MFIWLSYYINNVEIFISIIIGTFIYLIFNNYNNIYQFYLIDLILTFLTYYKKTNKTRVISTDNYKKIDNSINNINNINLKLTDNIEKKYIPKKITLKNTIVHTYNNIYSSSS